jgi:hypothetical protein
MAVFNHNKFGVTKFFAIYIKDSNVIVLCTHKYVRGISKRYQQLLGEL